MCIFHCIVSGIPLPDRGNVCELHLHCDQHPHPPGLHHSPVLHQLMPTLFYYFSKHLPFLCLQVFFYLTVAMFVNSTFGVVSTLTHLGFITVQYFAICRPLQHMSMVCKKKVVIFILLSWVVTIILASIPAIILFVMTTGCECSSDVLSLIMRVVVLGADSCMALVAVICTAVVCLCFRIYLEIRALQKRLSQFRFDQEVKGERNMYFTTLMLLATLTLFFIPYTTVYVISLHQSDWKEMNNSVLIYYMNILPYFKLLSDPIIYGMRMREIREGCRHFLVFCGCCQRCVNVHEYSYSSSSTRRTSGNGSLQMRSLSYREAYKWNNVRPSR